MCESDIDTERMMKGEDDEAFVSKIPSDVDQLKEQVCKLLAECVSLQAENAELKKDADALLELLKQSRKETELLQSRIDGGIRVHSWKDIYGEAYICYPIGTFVDKPTNATLVIDR